MAFSKEQIRTPTAIADIEVRLFSPDPTGNESAGATYSVQVRFSDGTMRVVAGNLTPHLSTAQINALLSFMADMRVKAKAEILP